MLAIESGVSEERLARSLNVDVRSITRKRNLLDGICQEAIDLLGNVRIVKFLAQRRADLLAEFQKIADMTSLKDAA